MTAVAAVAAVVVFLAAFAWSGVPERASAGLATAREALAVLRDPGQDDAAREAAAQRASLQLFATGGSILVRSAVALAVSSLPIVAAVLAGWTTVAAVEALLLDWRVIVGTSVVIVIGVALKRRLWPSS